MEIKRTTAAKEVNKIFWEGKIKEVNSSIGRKEMRKIQRNRWSVVYSYIHHTADYGSCETPWEFVMLTVFK